MPTGRGGSPRSSALRASASQTPPGQQPPSLLAVAGYAPQPSSAVGRKGLWNATPEFAAVARPPGAAPTLPPPRRTTLRQRRSHLLRVPGRGQPCAPLWRSPHCCCCCCRLRLSPKIVQAIPLSHLLPNMPPTLRQQPLTKHRQRLTISPRQPHFLQHCQALCHPKPQPNLQHLLLHLTQAPRTI